MSGNAVGAASLSGILNGMEAFLHQFLSGLANGGIYASIALALVMIYQATHHINFAQGEQGMFSAYVALTLMQAGFPYWAAFVARACVRALSPALPSSASSSAGSSNAPVLAVVVVFLGLLFIINSLAGWLFTYNVQAFPSPFPSGLGSRYLSAHEIGMIGVTLATLLLIYLFFRFTPLGLAMRAAAQNPDASRLVGIRVGWMLALGWGLAGAIGAIAAIMAAPIVYIEPNMMAGHSALRLCGGAAGRHQQSVGRGGRRLHRRRHREPRRCLRGRHRAQAFGRAGDHHRRAGDAARRSVRLAPS